VQPKYTVQVQRIVDVQPGTSCDNTSGSGDAVHVGVSGLSAVGR